MWERNEPIHGTMEWGTPALLRKEHMMEALTLSNPPLMSRKRVETLNLRL